MTVEMLKTYKTGVIYPRGENVIQVTKPSLPVQVPRKLNYFVT